MLVAGPATVVLRDRRAALDIDKVIGRSVGWRGPLCGGLPAALLVADGGGVALSSVSQKVAVELRPLHPLPPPPSDSQGAMGRVVAQSIIAFFRAHRCVGRNGRNSARALGPRGYLYASDAAASLMAKNRKRFRALWFTGRVRPG